MCRLKFVVIILFCSCFQLRCNADELNVPVGWRIPSDTLFDAEWRQSDNNKFLSFDADLNCDGLIDKAMVLEPADKAGVGVFVFIRGDNIFIPINVFDSTKDHLNFDKLNKSQQIIVQKRYKSAFGIRFVNNGMYKTACGKGYYDCGNNHPDSVTLSCAGIDFFHFDAGGNRYIFWDNHGEAFVSEFMSD